ncbi:VOC family protein [Campylobacter sp. faydin G-105]|uniref:VOC family protein n=1 Tax=Campylobacter anatolicus TaxID=2829105 RepID=UPI001B8F9C33|nr:VOC family protein [Campylobacter anatolicus]MBR8461767.1 VOC family protein [Campylobacter anatolicus]
MDITAIDHIVLTAKNLKETIEFYTYILGMELIEFGENNSRKALKFGNQKINLHQLGSEVLPNAINANIGTLDICLLTSTPLDEVLSELKQKGIAPITKIVQRSGANGAISSIYIRDPDGNLIEISQYI